MSKATLGVSSTLGIQNAGKFEGGDPFLAKLQKIDRDIRKFDTKNCRIVSRADEFPNNTSLDARCINDNDLHHEIKAGALGGGPKSMECSGPVKLCGLVNGPSSVRLKDKPGLQFVQGKACEELRRPFQELTNQAKPINMPQKMQGGGWTRITRAA